MKSAEIIKKIKAKHGVTSDYAVAKMMGVSRQLMSQWSRGTQDMGVADAITAAELLDIEPVKIIASVEIERARSDRQRGILSRYEGFADVALMAAITVLGTALLFPKIAGALGLYIMENENNGHENALNACPA